MKSIKNLVAIGAFSLLVLGIPAIASAQYNGGQNDPYNRNGGYGNGGYGNGGNNNGQYGNNGYYGDSRSIVRSLKSHARDFQRQLDRDLDHSQYNGSRREDEMNNLAKSFKDAVNDLNNNGYNNNNNDRYGNNGRYGNGNNNNQELRRVFDLASQIDRSIGRSGVSYESENYWSAIRGDLQELSRISNYNNNGRRNRNGNNNGGWNNGNRPSWWPF